MYCDLLCALAHTLSGQEGLPFSFLSFFFAYKETISRKQWSCFIYSLMKN